MVARADIPSKPVVYIVDDDEGVRRALSALLSAIRYNPVAFASPAEFLSKHDPDRPSCLLLDVHMPEMSGLEVQQQLIRSGSMLPVIFMTGYNDISMKALAIENGAFGFLDKPVGKEDLLGLIRSALRTTRRRKRTNRHPASRQPRPRA